MMTAGDIINFEQASRDLKFGLILNIINCYGEERLKTESYIACANKIGADFELKDVKIGQNAFDYFALRKFLNPLNSVRFFFLALIAGLDFLFRIFAGVLIVINYSLASFLTLPLKWISPKFGEKMSFLSTTPAMLVSATLHLMIHILKVITAHFFSPVNTFIRPVFWNYFFATENVWLKLMVTGLYVGLVVGAFIVVASVMPGVILPIPFVLLLVGAIVFSAPFLLYTGYEVIEQYGRSFSFLIDLILDGRFSYKERYAKFVDKTQEIQSLMQNDIKLKENVFAFQVSHEHGAISSAVYNSSKKAKIESSNPRSIFETALSFFTGRESKNPLLLTTKQQEDINNYT